VNLRELSDVTMSEKSLVRLCLVVSLIGLVIIYVMESVSGQNASEIADITKERVGESVRVCGIVSKMYVSNTDNTFFNLNDNASINVVVFSDKRQMLGVGDIKNGVLVCVDGTVAEYRGKLEIIAGRLVPVSRE